MLMLLRSCCPELHRVCTQQVSLQQHHGVLLLQARPTLLARLISTKASNTPILAIAPETDVESALAAAAEASGLKISNAEHLVSTSLHTVDTEGPDRLLSSSSAFQMPPACCGAVWSPTKQLVQHCRRSGSNVKGDYARFAAARHLEEVPLCS